MRSHREKTASPEEFIPKFLQAADALLAEAEADAPQAIGISCGGPLDTRRGVTQSPPNLPLWDEIPICDIFHRRYGCPVLLQNDANACALAEWRFGAGKGVRNMISLTFGTGLGAGLILDGRLYEGTNGMAGEAGHIRLKTSGPVGYVKAGSFEGFCSGAGIARLAAGRIRERRAAGKSVKFWPAELDAESVTAKAVCDAAKLGDADALDVVNESARRLGEGLSVLIDLLNPERIVIGGVFARAQELFRPEMEKAIAREALVQSAAICKVVPAQLGEAIGDTAALSLALHAREKTEENQ